MELDSLVQAIVDATDTSEGQAKRIVSALEQIAKAHTTTTADKVVAAINALRDDLRERAENTELVMTPTYGSNGAMTSARISRVKKGTK